MCGIIGFCGSENDAKEAILAGLKNLKNSTSSYIQLDTTRLYIASTAPTGDIPEGSVGIGFGGVQIYTSGTWTPST